ncbi:hypothetical protein DFH06DRAFT_1323617 [Mycena polygramma]|nr:hypothetical protein DFH06DRAFT_1323617 [Mycena polygramma]
MQVLAHKRFVISTLVCVVVTCFLLSAVVLRHSYLFRTDLNLEEESGPDPPAWASNTVLDPHTDPLHPFASLNGPPTASYKDNLRTTVNYITSWGSSAGWANDVISDINLMYLGLITDRVSILPAFTSTHFPGNTPPLLFSVAFDIPRLRRLMGKPILEWSEVKQTDSPILEDIGCWNVWESIQYNDPGPRFSYVPQMLNLDISYTKTPGWIKRIPNFIHDKTSTFWSLASLAFPEGHSASLVPPLPSAQHRQSLPPDEHLLCFDLLYYMGTQDNEIARDYSPAWRYVGQHMRWTAALEQLGHQYVRHTLQLHADEPIPPFIAVHARRDDFQNWCGDFTPEECFPPLDVMTRRIEEVKAEIWRRKGIVVEYVIITSDERDKAWWNQVAEFGWKTPDHARLNTQEQYGIWYPVLIDAVIHSQASGFVGTDRSTFSILSARRVDSWQDGPVRYVKWGHPGADDH